MRLFNLIRMGIYCTVFCAVLAQAQTSSAQAKSCPQVTAKNPQEALMMEQASNKQGCWARDKKTGQLVFLSNLPPNQNYKPLAKSSNDIDPVPAPERPA